MASSTNKKQLDLKKQEINFFYGKIGEVEAVLKEQKKVCNRLRQDVELKISQLMNVEAQLASEREHFRWRKETVLSDMELLRETGDGRLRALRDAQVAVEYAIAEYDVVTAENDKLHLRYKTMVHEHALQTAQQSAEREERKQKDFDTRISMEVILRQAVKAADETYKLQASEKMGDEAVLARQENLALTAAKGKWEEMCKKMVQHQQESYEELMRARVAKEVMAATTSQQEFSLVVLERNNVILLDEINELREHVQGLQASIGQTELALAQRKALKGQVNAAKRALKAAKAARKEACEQAISICHLALEKSIAVIERDQAKKAAKLSSGLGNIGGGEEEAEEEKRQDSPPPPSRASRSQLSSAAPSTSKSASAVTPSATIDLDPDAVWNSRKSDIHLADALRRKIRNVAPLH